MAQLLELGAIGPISPPPGYAPVGQDVEVVPSSAFTQRTCDRCGSLQKGGNFVATSPVALRKGAARGGAEGAQAPPLAIRILMFIS